MQNDIQLQGEDERSDGRRTLSRKPKTLDAPPSLFQAGGGPPMASGAYGLRDKPASDATPPPGSEGSAFVEHQGTSRDLADLLEDAPPDPQVVAMTRQIAATLALRRRPRRDRSDLRAGHLTPSPYRYRSDEVDLDRTLAVLAENPHPADTDIIVRERTQSPRAAAVVIDVSGSMRGEKARMAAATVGALVSEFGHDQVSVVAFWSDAALVKPLDITMSTTDLLDQLLRIPARGLTNVAFGLEVAARELARSSARRRVGVLLTDALHNAGPDPRDVARRFRELHVLTQVDGSHDLALASEIARGGRGRVASVRTYRDVAPALNRLLKE